MHLAGLACPVDWHLLQTSAWAWLLPRGDEGFQLLGIPVVQAGEVSPLPLLHAGPCPSAQGQAGSQNTQKQERGVLQAGSI